MSHIPPSPERQHTLESPSPPWAGLPLRLIDLILIMILSAGALLGMRALLPVPEMTTTVVITVLIGQNIILFAVVWLVAVVWRGASWRQLGFRPVDRLWFRRAVLLALALQVAVIVINLLIAAVTGETFENPQIDVLMPETLNWPTIIGLLLATSIVVPIAEELALRSILFGWLRKHMTLIPAAVISAVGFAVLHGAPALIPGTFAVGLMLAWIYERSGSIWPGVVLHGIFNAISTLMIFAAVAFLNN